MTSTDSQLTNTLEQDERNRRWRLILGGHDADGIGQSLNAHDQKLDQCLDS